MFERPGGGEKAVLVQLDFGQGDVPERLEELKLLAASAGVGIPLLRQKFGADPAVGGSVMITALTDSGGFFIFLGLATLFPERAARTGVGPA